jgi:hypothetical protein
MLSLPVQLLLQGCKPRYDESRVGANSSSPTVVRPGKILQCRLRKDASIVSGTSLGGPLGVLMCRLEASINGTRWCVHERSDSCIRIYSVIA